MKSKIILSALIAAATLITPALFAQTAPMKPITAAPAATAAIDVGPIVTRLNSVVADNRIASRAVTLLGAAANYGSHAAGIELQNWSNKVGSTNATTLGNQIAAVHPEAANYQITINGGATSQGAATGNDVTLTFAAADIDGGSIKAQPTNVSGSFVSGPGRSKALGTFGTPVPTKDSVGY